MIHQKDEKTYHIVFSFINGAGDIVGKKLLAQFGSKKGGSLITADIANSYNREVFAVPGSPTQIQSKGV